MEVTELKAETSVEEVKQAIKQTQTGKFPGHSHITYEFWKSWKEPKKTAKKMMIRNLQALFLGQG